LGETVLLAFRDGGTAHAILLEITARGFALHLPTISYFADTAGRRETRARGAVQQLNAPVGRATGAVSKRCHTRILPLSPCKVFTGLRLPHLRSHRRVATWPRGILSLTLTAHSEQRPWCCRIPVTGFYTQVSSGVLSAGRSGKKRRPGVAFPLLRCRSCSP